MKTYLTILVLVLGAFGCSKGPPQTPPAVNIEATEISGDWVLASASPTVQQVFTPDRFPSAQLHFATNGEANYNLIPIEEVLGSVPAPKSQWTVGSGRGSWDLMAWQENGQGVWRVGLQTQTGTVPLRAEKDASGMVSLAYYPSSGTNAALVFKKAQ